VSCAPSADKPRWDRDALGQLRLGHVEEWAGRYSDHGRLVAEPTAAKTRQHLVDDWWKANTDGCDAVMIAHRRVDVAELNDRARSLMRADGRLGRDEVLDAEGRPFAAGDRVLVKRNERRLGLINGTRADVCTVDAEQRALTLTLKDGTSRQIDAATLDRGGLLHGYAVTAHAAQGATVDRSFVLGSDDLYLEWGYTAMTRHREEARFYVVSPGSAERALSGLEPDNDPTTADAVTGLTRSARKHTATDVRGEPDPAARAQAAAQSALDRAARVQRRLDEIKPWQRKLGKDLRSSLERNQNDAAHWTGRALELQTEPQPERCRPARATTTLPSEELRALLNDPGAVVHNNIGPKPDGLAGRDLWMRAAGELISDPHVSLDPPETDLSMTDTGLEL
jgi:hypothetical protein